MTDQTTEAATDLEWRTRFDCENPEAGLYLSSQTPLTVITPPEGEPTVLVDAQAFMEMQKQRDDMRRALGLINAWRRTPGRGEAHFERLLGSVGFGDEDGDVMRGLIASARAMRTEQT